MSSGTSILLICYNASSIKIPINLFYDLNMEDSGIWNGINHIRKDSLNNNLKEFSFVVWYTYDDKYSAIGLMLFTKHDFLWVNVSNEACPWYAPIPLIPTPPNGNDSTKNLKEKKIHSIMLLYITNFTVYTHRHIASLCHWCTCCLLVFVCRIILESLNLLWRHTKPTANHCTSNRRKLIIKNAIFLLKRQKFKLVTHPELMNCIASNALSTVTIGKMGPKISSCITGSVRLTLIRMVGSIYLSSAFVFPPNAISAPFNIFTRRLQMQTKKNYNLVNFKNIFSLWKKNIL